MRPSISSSLVLAILLLSLLQHTAAAKSGAISFCKCICFNNSTIIALNPPNSRTSSHHLDIRSSDLQPLDGISPALVDREAQGEEKTPAKPHHKLTCADCTRAFCLDYNLPICKDATDEDVFTTCFRKNPRPLPYFSSHPEDGSAPPPCKKILTTNPTERDSLKDEFVVVIFIIATAGLLAWAVVKPWIDRVRQRNERREFPPLVGSQGGQAGHDAAPPRTQNSGRGGASGSGRRGGRGGGGRNGVDARFLDADEDAVDIGSGSGLGAVR